MDIRSKAISDLSGRSYYNRKRFGVIAIVVLVVIVLAFVFYFSGKNLRYFLLINSGIGNYEKGNLTYAISDFNSALNLKPSGAIALDGLGLVAVKQNDFEKAAKYYTEALSAGLKPNAVINHTKYGNVYIDSGLYKNAQAEFNHALELNQMDSEALFGLGCCYHAYCDIDTAISYYTKALTYSPKMQKAQKNLADAQDAKNKGAIYYLFDANGSPLARYNLIATGSKKTYVLGPKAAHITGFVASDRNQSAGIEKYFADYIPGNRIYLTIDTRVQEIISKALGWYKGSIVIIRPQTGEILGLYNQPTFDPNTVSKDWWKIVGNKNNPFLNRAIDKLYEPGSIAKLMTMAGFIESNINETGVFPVKCSGSTVFNGKPFWCWAKHGRVKSMEQAMAESCNIGAAFMGFALGAPRLSEFCNKFGFGSIFDLGINDATRNVKISIPVKQSTSPSNDTTRYDIAMHACGLGDQFRITPLHSAMLAAAVANDGVMMKPYLIKEIRNINGKIIYKSTPEELKKAISVVTAKKITALMVNDIEKGIAKKAKVKGLSIAGKTGTSGKSNGLNAWFIAFAPADLPQYAVGLVCDSEGKGMVVAAPVAAAIFQELLK